MTCKNCIHYCVCKDLAQTLEMKGCICNNFYHFKDKASIVELPCNLGDDVYYISIKRYSPLSYKLLKAKVINFCIDINGINTVELNTLKSNFTFTLPIFKVYFEKSKAEAKLKELNEK